jgi:4-diphosphocytidyl-2-C-methyl-D-erythritol kinase
MIRWQAPAKVNLFLHVTGRREDGFHTLQSLICFADIGDEISLEYATTKDDFTITGEFAHAIAHNTDNLVWQMIEAVRNSGRHIPPLAITLEKNLPVAAGLGGGSCDAAAALHALESLTQIEIAPDARFRILASLGSDLPACYHAKTALMEDTGHRITPWPDLPDLGILLVNPRQPLPTGGIYRGVTAFRAEQSFSPPLSRDEWLALLANSTNDLQSVAEKQLPVIAEICRELHSLPDCLIARMSGSGASCFALFENREMAESAAQSYSHRHPSHWVKAGNIIRSTAHG